MALRLGIGTTVAAACAAILWLLPIGSTFGKPGAIKLKLAQGTLRVAAPAVSASATGATSVTVTVVDARGVGTGWSLQLVSRRPVSVSRLVARCAARSTCTLPVSGGVGSPLVLHATRGSGMGVVKLVVTLGRLAKGTPATPVRFTVAPS